jgi:hypothetical protein
MIAFIFSFAFFALSTVGVVWSIIKQEVLRSPMSSARQTDMTYIIYSACYFISQSTLVVLFYRINSQCLEMSSVNESKQLIEDSELVE